MSTATANEAGGLSTSPSHRAASVGPLELKHMRHANYRAVADDSRITPTHRHIAIANSLGWGFDGMDGVIFALVAPLIIKDFGLTVPQYRTGLQISLFIGIAGLYFWPWLSDRYGRRTLLAINIALFSLLMPVVAASPTFSVFVIARSIVGFALNGEWSLGSMLVAETWPAHLRGRVISINRAAWCFGASLAGAITGIAAAAWGWRIAVMVPGVIALLAIYVRATCPESPYWVRTQDRKTRVRGALERGEPVGEEDRAWYLKADKIGIRQVFMSDTLPATLVALFVACCSTCRPRKAGRRRNTAPSTSAGASWDSLACGSRAGWPIGSAGGSPSSSSCSKAASSSPPGSSPRVACCCGSSAWRGASASWASGGPAPCSRPRSFPPAPAASPTAWSGPSPTSSASSCGRSRRSPCSRQPAPSSSPSSASRCSCC